MPRNHTISRAAGFVFPLRQRAFLAAACMAGVIGLTSAPASSQEGGSIPDDPAWIPMQELTTGIKPPDNVVVRIWQDVLQAEADTIRSGDGQIYVRGERTTLPDDGFRPSDFLWARFEAEGAEYIVSIMGQRPPACDNGPNSATATTIHSVCPARLTTIPKDGSNATTVEQPGACTIWPSQAVEPEPNTGSFAKMEGDMISLEAMQNGTPVPDCRLTFSLEE